MCWFKKYFIFRSKIHCLDIQNNKIDNYKRKKVDEKKEKESEEKPAEEAGGEEEDETNCVDEVLWKMPEIKVLYLKGNPCVRKIKSYRKWVTVALPELTYLDDRPVFKDDRRCWEWFIKGGLTGEREERKKIKQEERDAHENSLKAFRQMVDQAKSAGREKKLMMWEDKYDFSDPLGENYDPVETWETRHNR